MTLGCQHSPSVSGGVARRSRDKKIGESRLCARSGVANGSREWSHERESRMGVVKVVAKRGSRMGVAIVVAKRESQMGVAKWSREKGVAKWSCENKKIWGRM